MYTIMTIIGKEVVGRDADATWPDVVEFATEVDQFEETWVDHDFIENVRDHGQALRRHHDGISMVLRIAVRNPLVTLRKTGDML